MRSVDASTMRDIDKKAQEFFGIPEILLMESAGREAALEILKAVKGRKGKIAFFCGKGNNGGDGLVAARYCFLREIPLVVFLVGRKETLKNSARINFDIFSRYGNPIHEVGEGERLRKVLSETVPFILGVDALLGIGLTGEVQEPYRSAIEAINHLSCPVLAIDIPSGLCATTGRVLGCCVQADQTVTFGLPKKGFSLGEGPKKTGNVIVKNIGYPKSLLT